MISIQLPVVRRRASSKAVVTADSPLSKETSCSAEAKGPKTCRRQKQNEEKICLRELKEHYYEVDENNVIRALRIDPTRESKECAVLSLEQSHESTKVPPHKTSSNPIQWRLHREVAIEVTEFKLAVALHDLMDESNSSLMVVTHNHAIIQGQYDHVMNMFGILWESWGLNHGNQVISTFSKIAGKEGLLYRQGKRTGGLVNIHHEYVPMDWKKGDQLMSKVFSLTDDEDLWVMDLRLADPSPQEHLGYGRRLVRMPGDCLGLLV
ncbi:hypothetical protein F4774DRAFT_408154 [Daldinia eschscholtzii]|nr:hypothetical protein F4774DRAFT_408154 [Daldinia eschscholtzii]